MAGRRLLRSCASGVDPAAQSAVEAAMLRDAHRGEIRLHVSSIAGDAISVGAHAPAPGPTPAGSLGTAFRRRTGGRPVACGEAFRLVTLALPRRTSLAGDGAAPIAPEQVLNRAVRGLQAGLRRLGLDPTYPGLDLVTIGGRSVAHLSFAETVHGAVLFQATLACHATLAESTRMLDALDPDGVVPTTPISPATATSLDALVARGPAGDGADGAREEPAARPDLSPEGLARLLASTWAEAAGLEVEASEPPRGADHDEPREAPCDGPFPTPPAGATTMAPSRLGIALAWVQANEGRIARAAIGGDLLARDGARDRIARALEGCPADRTSIGRTVDAVLDRDETWVLGITPTELADLVARAAQEHA